MRAETTGALEILKPITGDELSVTESAKEKIAGLASRNLQPNCWMNLNFGECQDAFEILITETQLMQDLYRVADIAQAGSATSFD